MVAVFTAEDLARQSAPLFASSRMKGYYATPILPLARGKVRYVGEPIVGIVAQSRYLAEDALELIDIEFEPLAGRHRSVEKPLKTTRRCCTRRPAPTSIVAREFKRGDVDAALAEAPVRVSGRFRMHRKTPVAIEPRAYLGRIRRRSARAHTYIRRHRSPASCAMRLSNRARHVRQRCAWSPPTSAAVLAVRARSIRRRFSSAPRRATSAVRLNGPATGWKT